METIEEIPITRAGGLSRLLQIGINGNTSWVVAPRHRSILSRLLQIGINGNGNPRRHSVNRNFPDYFKSELMETPPVICDNEPGILFPDYFKSELMETAGNDHRIAEATQTFPITSNRN